MSFTLHVTFAADARPVPTQERHPAIPMPATAGAAGLDLSAWIPEPVTLRPMQRLRVPTGLSLAIPEGFEGQVRPRSGLAFKHGVTVLNAPGTIDSDYRGEVAVLLINLSETPFTVACGDRIAQLVIAPVTRPSQVVHLPVLPQTARGAGGFGSTGLSAPSASLTTISDT